MSILLVAEETCIRVRGVKGRWRLLSISYAVVWCMTKGTSSGRLPPVFTIRAVGLFELDARLLSNCRIKLRSIILDSSSQVSCSAP